MIPGGPRNARQMQMMMRRLGMTSDTLDGVDEVIVRTRKEEHVFHQPEVTVVTVQGVKTYQVVGTPEVRPRSTSQGGSSAVPAEPPHPAGPPPEDVDLVMEQAGVSREEAIAALRASDGAPAEAILKLLSRRNAGGA